jgi:hypothetical protein
VFRTSRFVAGSRKLEADAEPLRRRHDEVHFRDGCVGSAHICLLAPPMSRSSTLYGVAYLIRGRDDRRRYPRVIMHHAYRMTPPRSTPHLARGAMSRSRGGCVAPVACAHISDAVDDVRARSELTALRESVGTTCDGHVAVISRRPQGTERSVTHHGTRLTDPRTDRNPNARVPQWRCQLWRGICNQRPHDPGSDRTEAPMTCWHQSTGGEKDEQETRAEGRIAADGIARRRHV